ncbi:hypothetical protein Rhe02_05270 [Rhizocola hellebori]|uniref:Uncharacterized protein n=1 Tax=Rhizocola hellebori TaxID=1392758 RepID=A0A8J3Q297_9ACTN|nr:hypothetical protein [Rhizocola hellebori]GIH02460.1 hypothetical protein Rhe02_05270 [Rhizocola hellebori]
MADALHRLDVELDGVPLSQASALASELREFLLDEDGALQIEQVRANADTQDLGATLVILLGTPALVAVARGVERWIARRNSSSVIISSGADQVEVTNLSNRKAGELAEKLVQLTKGAGGS